MLIKMFGIELVTINFSITVPLVFESAAKNLKQAMFTSKVGMSPKSKIGLICVVVIIVLIVGGVGYYASQSPVTPTTPTTTTTTPTTPPTSSPEEFEPQIVTFPYTWVEYDMEVTVVNFTALGKSVLVIEEIREGAPPPPWEKETEEGYQFYGVYTTFKNLRDARWDCYPPEGPLAGCVFELETDKGNVYKSLTAVRALFFEPHQEKEKWGYFEILDDEKPVELRCLKVVNPDAHYREFKLSVAYIWKIAQ